MERLVPSAVVLLTRGGGEELFLCLRARACAFFGGYLALPGGKVDAVDLEAAGGDAERALAACAARELFEETGVLAPGIDLGADAGALRAGLAAGSADARDAWRRGLCAGAALDALAPAGELITPPFAPVRYRTRVFHLEWPGGREPAVVAGELESGAWTRAAEALDAWRRGAARVAPPVAHVLEALAAAPPARAREACASACARQAAGEAFCAPCAPGVAVAPMRTPTVPPATTTNAYLVGIEAPLIVDPGTPYPDEQRRLIDALERRAAAGRAPAGILLTHHHRDHVGAVSALSTRFDLPVHAHARTLERLEGAFVRGRALADGDELALGRAPDGSEGWTLRALHTPGHDRGHLIFVESRYGAALLGDLCSTLSTIVIDPPEGHMATYLASLERARDLAVAGEIALACPAHGPTSARPAELLEGYLAHRKERERTLHAALRDAPRALADLCDEVYADAAPAVRAYALRSLAAGLEKLVEEGRARAAGGGYARAVTPRAS